MAGHDVSQEQSRTTGEEEAHFLLSPRGTRADLEIKYFAGSCLAGFNKHTVAACLQDQGGEGGAPLLVALGMCVYWEGRGQVRCLTEG